MATPPTPIPVRLENAVGFTAEHLIPLVDDGLGNSVYLVDLGDGRALAVDASRDLRARSMAADRRFLTGGAEGWAKVTGRNLEDGA
ncbi:hypothetical protein OHU34_00940 [Streptomyces sp. NBC_00080]|uniref:hypothetical protein n=1 Tax=Streptomyces TaxID=1883 RepID=UPI00116A8CC6|nr:MULTISPECIES: hypothetical protein [Streptomyces]TQJ36977.1 hypothetical protein FBY34_8740 [Streptomyces sp. SLBN-115]